MTPDREIIITSDGRPIRVAHYHDRIYVSGLRVDLVVLNDQAFLRVVVGTRRGLCRQAYRFGAQRYAALVRAAPT